ncbi:unnamed protein product [Closterium sp. NIES-65]|nr:unnamed protein product [Closterium sp. NIES-65]
MEPVPPPSHSSGGMAHARVVREDSMDRLHQLASHRPVLHRRHSHNHSRQSPKSLLQSKPASAAHRLVFMRNYKQGSPSQTLSHGSPTAVASRGDSSSVGIGTPQPSHHSRSTDKPPQASTQSAEPTPLKEIRRQHSWPLPPQPSSSEAAAPATTATPAATVTTGQRAAPASSVLRQPACSMVECSARGGPRARREEEEEEEVSSWASSVEEKPLTAAAVHVGDNRKYDIVAVGFWLAALQQGCPLVKLSRRRPGRTKQRNYFVYVERTGAVRVEARLLCANKGIHSPMNTCHYSFAVGQASPVLHGLVRASLSNFSFFWPPPACRGDPCGGRAVHLYGTETTDAFAMEFRMYTSEGQIMMRAHTDDWFQIWIKGMRSIIEYAKVLSWTLQI